jgi:hypothetical protein
VPVTHGVAGSSPVRTAHLKANTAFKSFKAPQFEGFFIFSPFLFS